MMPFIWKRVWKGPTAVLWNVGWQGKGGSGVVGKHLHYFHYFLMANPEPLLRPPSVREERQAFFPLHFLQC